MSCAIGAYIILFRTTIIFMDNINLHTNSISWHLKKPAL